MNNLQHQLAVKEAVKGRFKGSRPLVSKVTPAYPDTAEREFQRITNRYMRVLNKTLKKHLPAMMAAYQRQRHGDSRFDDIRDVENTVNDEIHKAAEEIEQAIAEFGLEEFIEKIANMTKNKTLSEWKRVVQETLGIDLMDDYYKGDFYARALKDWVDGNVLKIKSIPTETLGRMQNIILDGYRQGMTIRDLTKLIQEEYGTTRHRAAMLARDQVATLNAQITKLQQQDAGVTHYRWSDSRDSRVRDCHRALNGKVFSWDEPPEMWYETKSRGRVYTGRRCHPGEDYCCRCIAIPEFDYDTIDIPMKPLDSKQR